MDVFEAIESRRSIRTYTGDDVPEGHIETILKAAMAAPSACNQQPWEFVVVRDKAVLAEVPSFHPFSSMLPKAACGIFVCGNTTILPNAKCVPYWTQDCSAATQNMLLAAHALGLGAVWLGAYPQETICGKLSRLLSLPKGVIPFSIVAVGVPAEQKGPAGRYDVTRIHYERW